MFRNFDDLKKFFVRKSSKRISSVLTARDNGSNVAVYIQKFDTPLFVVNSDNTLEFKLDLYQLLQYKSSVQTVHRYFPIYIHPKAATHISVSFGYGVGVYAESTYRVGLKLDLNTHKFINPKVYKAIPKVRAQWLRDLRLYKAGLRTRIKLGVVDSILETVLNDRTLTRKWTAPIWTYPEHIALFIEAMKTQDYNNELLREFFKSSDTIRSSIFFFKTMPSREEQYAYIESFFKTNSFILRDAYGVFG